MRASSGGRVHVLWARRWLSLTRKPVGSYFARLEAWQPRPKMEDFDSSSPDIVIVGAGGCGLVAALAAARKGARVLVLEKTDKPGGGTVFSSRSIRAAGTKLQRAKGIEDDGAARSEERRVGK